ncbi:hypothetical protein PGTUg99_021893 [Puccinia graminis f. sp. tritici]|uniref:Uncharacterized protein n=1 Tax=Puccinia graminis f. sp. tritici TaxID=56615 RepID=A0A5B0RUD2_PUCGR|nr:hypothetical protein PGTUg99_021893 [Puccinia graminis f. sp. tritici]
MAHEHTDGQEERPATNKRTPPPLPPRPPLTSQTPGPSRLSSTISTAAKASQENPESSTPSHAPSSHLAQRGSPGQSTPINSSQQETHQPVRTSTSDSSFGLDSTTHDRRNGSDCEPDSYDETLAEIEALEVSEFLRRSSKYLNQINFQTLESEGTATLSVPTLDDFRSSAGLVDWIGFCNAYAAAQLDRYLPNALLSSPTRTPTSMSRLKAQASRSYVAILPELWDIISGNQLSKLYRWENPRRTAFYLLTYYLLWAMDLIPSFIVGYILYRLINRQLNPPTISELRQEVSQRHQLGKQAEKIGSEGFLDNKSGMSGSVTKGVLGNSMVFAGVAMGANIPGLGTSPAAPPPSSSHSLPKKHDYRSLYSFSRSLYSEHAHEIENLLADMADIGEKIRNLYLWRRPRACWRTSLMLTGILLYTLAITQKWMVKNFLGWLGIEFFFLLGFTDQYPKFRKILNPIWLILYDIPTDSEFALEVLQERGQKNHHSLGSHRKLFKRHHHRHPSDFMHKKSRSASSLFDRKRENSTDENPGNPASPIQSGCIISSDRSVASAVCNVPEPDIWKRWGRKVVHGSSGVANLARKVYAGAEHSHPEHDQSKDSNKSVEGTALNSPKTFAFLNGKVPGNLAVHRDWITFEPLKGFRTKTTNLKSTLNKPEPVPMPPRTRTLSTNSSSTSSLRKLDLDRKPSGEELGGREIGMDEGVKHSEGVEDLAAGGPSSADLLIQFKDVISIKKVKRSLAFGFGFRISDGIEFLLDGSIVLSFDNILNRDEYFNHLLLLCSHHLNRKKKQ